MTTVIKTYRVTIKAAPEKVFAYVSDLTRHPEWSGGELKIEPLAAGPIAVGSRYQSRGEVAGQKDRPNELRITQYDPPTRFTFIAKDADFGDVSHEFTFKPEAGGTLMERTVTITMSPITALAFNTVIFPFIGRPMMNKAFAALQTKFQ